MVAHASSLTINHQPSTISHRLSPLFAAVVLAAGALTVLGCGERKPTLHLYNWADYISPEAMSGFEKEFGVKVVQDLFASNEDLLAKLQSGAKGYDVIVPSDYMVRVMIKQGMLAEIDLANVPNLKNLGKRFRGQDYDPENKYSVGYLYGTAGIGYNSEAVKTPPDSWAILWDEKFKGRICMMNDARETLGAALKYLGYSLNTTNPDEIAKAKDLLIKQKPLVRKYDSESPQDLLIAGEVALCHGWSGTITLATKEKPAVKYLIPKEGGSIFHDNLCIPKGARNKRMAEEFINYLLRPEIGGGITNVTKFPNCNEAAKPFIKKEILENPTIYPPDEVLDKLEPIRDVGQATALYDRAWTEIKASR